MGMLEQVIRDVPDPRAAGPLDRIAEILDRAERGVIDQDGALDAIASVLRRRPPVETYQKPWG